MKEVIEHLRKLGNGEIEPTTRQFGLCKELANNFNRKLNGLALEFVAFAVKDWPEYSGFEYYPIKSSKYRTAELAYSATRNLWDDNPYGDARRRLCLWLADYIENNLDEVNEFLYG